MVTKPIPAEKAAEIAAYREFVIGFAEAAEMDPHDVVGRWAAYAGRLTETERLKIESGGREAGLSHGKDYASLFEGADIKHPLA